MPLRDIEAVSGMEPAAQIPASKEVVMTLNMGAPFAEAMHPKGLIVKSLRSFVDELIPEAKRPRRRRRLLGVGR